MHLPLVNAMVAVTKFFQKVESHGFAKDIQLQYRCIKSDERY
jgi:hypothetical protein